MYGWRYVLAVAVFTVFAALVYQTAFSAEIDLSAIKQIESSGNPLAYNKSSQARGLYQITPICLKEWNNFNKDQYTVGDLYNPVINERIARWYLEVRIPQMLKHYGFEVTIEKVLISYNAGISYVVKGITLPKETKDYIVKYKEAL